MVKCLVLLLSFVAASHGRVCELASYDLEPNEPSSPHNVADRVQQATINECAIACGAHVTCTMAQYAESQGACTLFAPAQGNQRPQRQQGRIPGPWMVNIGCAKWVEQAPEMHRADCPNHELNFTLVSGQRYYDGVIDAMSASSAQACAEACYKNVLCTGANLHSVTKSCELTSSHTTDPATSRNGTEEAPPVRLVVTNKQQHVAITELKCVSRRRSIADYQSLVRMLTNLLAVLRASAGNSLGDQPSGQGPSYGRLPGSAGPGQGRPPFGGAPGPNGPNPPHRPPSSIGPGPSDQRCGLTPVNPSINVMSMRAQSVGQTRILGGLETVPHSWPWQITIMLSYRGSKPSLICGGSLISDRAFVTAAHCFKLSKDLSQYTFMVGAHTLSDRHEQRITLKALNFHVHERYGKAKKHAADIAVVNLAEPVRFSAHVQPICISTGKVRAGERCVATGWGKNDAGQPSDVLLQTVVQVVDTTVCNDAKHYKGRIHRPSMFCAADQGKDSCQGDSGGPLVCSKGDGTWRLAGIISWGVGCGNPSKPGVYVRVEQFQSWIADRTKRGVSGYSHRQRTSNIRPPPLPVNTQPQSTNPISRAVLFGDPNRVTLFPRHN